MNLNSTTLKSFVKEQMLNIENEHKKYHDKSSRLHDEFVGKSFAYLDVLTNILEHEHANN